MQVQHCCQVQPAAAGADVRDVPHPSSIMPGLLKLKGPARWARRPRYASCQWCAELAPPHQPQPVGAHHATNFINTYFHALGVQRFTQRSTAIAAATRSKRAVARSQHQHGQYIPWVLGGCVCARRSSRIGLLEVPGMPWPRTRPSFAATPPAGSSPELAGKEDRGFFKSLHIALRLAIFRFQLANALVLGGGWFSNTAQARLLCFN